MPVTWIGNRRVEVPEGEAEPKPKKVEELAKAPESTEEEE